MNSLRLGPRSVVALFVVFLHYVPQITIRMAEDRRYCDWWGPATLGKILLGTIVLTGTAVALDWLVRRSRSALLRRAFNHVFLLVLASGLLAAFPAFTETHPRTVQALWCLALAVVVGSFPWPRSPLVRIAVALCLILSPLVPLLVVQMLLWPSWSGPAESLGSAPPPEVEGTPVFVFVFDGWSWARSTRDGEFLPALENTRRLCEQSLVFRHAVAPDDNTMQSLPRIIFQTDRRFAPRGGTALLIDGDDEVPCRQCPSMFQWARQQGYETYLLGWMHPYRRMLGDQVEHCRSYFPGEDAGLPEQVAGELLYNSNWWTDPFSGWLCSRVTDYLDVKYLHHMTLQMRHDLLDVLSACPAKGLVLCHVTIPHAPYAFNPDGSFRPQDERVSATEAYLRQVQYADKLLGEIVGVLRCHSKFERSLFIVTSDHGWQFERDPAFQRDPQWKRRVPLIVKLPGQREGRVIDQPICTNQLRPLLEAVFRGEVRADELAALAGARVATGTGPVYASAARFCIDARPVSTPGSSSANACHREWQERND